MSVERGSSHSFWLARLVWNQVLFRFLVVRVHRFFILKCAWPPSPKSSSIHAEPREWTLASQCWSSGFVCLNLYAIFTTLSIRSVHYVKQRNKNIKAIEGYAFLSLQVVLNSKWSWNWYRTRCFKDRYSSFKKNDFFLVLLKNQVNTKEYTLRLFL